MNRLLPKQDVSPRGLVFHHKVHKGHKGNLHKDIKIFVFLVAFVVNTRRRETDQDWF